MRGDEPANEEDGTTLSDSVTVQNTRPEITEVSLSPSTAYTNDTLTATVTTNDDDGDAVSLGYEWYVDGSLVAETSASLNGATDFDKDDEVYVVVTPNDGYDDGDSVSSDSIIVSNTGNDNCISAPRTHVFRQVPMCVSQRMALPVMCIQ